MNPLKVEFERLREGAFLPTRQNVGDAGWDLTIPNPLEEYTLYVGSRKIPVGLTRDHPVKEVAEVLGMDVTSPESEIVIPPGSRVLIPLGFAVALPPESGGFGYEMQFRPRSGSALKLGLTLANGVGTIDSSYRGECGVILLNTSEESIEIQPGDRVAQAVFSRYEVATFEEVAKLSETTRGSGGFGSTGV